VVCAVALLHIHGYERLVKRIMPGFRRLGLHVLLVRNQGRGAPPADYRSAL